MYFELKGCLLPFHFHIRTKRKTILPISTHINSLHKLEPQKDDRTHIAINIYFTKKKRWSSETLQIKLLSHSQLGQRKECKRGVDSLAFSLGNSNLIGSYSRWIQKKNKRKLLLLHIFGRKFLESTASRCVAKFVSFCSGGK